MLQVPGSGGPKHNMSQCGVVAGARSHCPRPFTAQALGLRGASAIPTACAYWVRTTTANGFTTNDYGQ